MSRLVAAMRRTSTCSSCVAADAGERAVLQKPQQFGLERLAHVADFVQKNRAAIGFLDAAGFLFHRAGESALFVAEQFAFQEGFRNGGAIDADVIVRAPLAQAVQRAGDEFLARAAFAQDQDPRVGGGDGLDQLPQIVHARRFAHDLFEAENFGGAGAQRGVFLQQPVAFGAARDGMQQFLRRERLGQVINGARP